MSYLGENWRSLAGGLALFYFFVGFILFAVVVSLNFYTIFQFHNSFNRPVSCPKHLVQRRLNSSLLYDNHYCPFIFADNLNQPAGIDIDENGAVLVFEAGEGEIVVLHDLNDNGFIDDYADDDEDSNDSNPGSEREVLLDASAHNLTRDLILHDGYLYASSQSQVLRWRYHHQYRKLDNESMQIVVNDIPRSRDMNQTRGLEIFGHFLYLSVPSRDDNYRPHEDLDVLSRIVRFDLDSIPHEARGYDFEDGATVATGLRASFGMKITAGAPTGKGNYTFWMTEISRERAHKLDGGFLTNEFYHPLHEINSIYMDEKMVTEPIRLHTPNFGYPKCFTLPQTVFRDEKFPQQQDFDFNDIYDNETCIGVKKPTFTLPIDSVPFDITSISKDISGYFPGIGENDLLVALYGKTPPLGITGNMILLIRKNHKDHELGQEYFWFADGAQWNHSPTSMEFGKCQLSARKCLYFSTEQTGKIIAIGYNDNYSAP